MTKMTAAAVKAITKPGMHADGAGLYLRVSKGGAKGWIFRHTVDGRRREMGLGSFPAVSLAAARTAAGAHRAAVADGADPVADRRRERTPTFEEAARTVHELNMPRWKNGKHNAQWIATLETYAFPAFGKTALDRIERRDVLAVLTGGKAPLWTTKPETARRVRQRIRSVFAWALAHDYVQANPAGEAIDAALPKMPRLGAHFRALPYADIPAALDTIEATGASMAAKQCLRFLILTAARSGEARGACWSEMDLDAREWRIPGPRMKAGQPHRVPLSDAALAVLREAAPFRDPDCDLVFPSPLKPGAMLSDMTLTKVLRDTGLADRATVHGFRSSFRDWAGECTDAPQAVMERALAHAVGNAVEQAYARSDLLERRRGLMDQWAAFVDGGPDAGGGVIELDRERARRA